MEIIWGSSMKGKLKGKVHIETAKIGNHQLAIFDGGLNTLLLTARQLMFFVGAIRE
ncbi:hypothetical protein ACE6H2_021555 [Prunus campanulata]